MQKRKGHVVILLAFLVLLGMIACPVSASIKTTGYFPNAEKAYSYEGSYGTSFTVNSSQAIAQIQVRAPKGTELNYTFTYGAGNTMSGYIQYLDTGFALTDYTNGAVEIGIGSSVAHRDIVDTGLLRKWELVGYAREEDDDTGNVTSKGYAITDVSAGLGNVGFQSGFMAYESVPQIYPIESFTFTSDEPVLIEIFTADRTEIETGASKTAIDEINEWVTFALAIGASVLAFAWAVFYIIKFFFIDNLLLVIALWIAVTMAYSAITSVGNIFGFYKKFFRLQRTMLNFIIELWNYLIQIVSAFRGIFRI